MQVHRSNRLERLADRLAELVSSGPPADPLATEHLVVQSRGMGQWVSLALVERLGVVARLDLLRPRELVERALTAALGDPEEFALRWRRERMAWSLMALLPELLPRPEFAPLRAWVSRVGGDDEVGRRWQLARRIARTLDQYAVYRPEMVLGWSRGSVDGRVGVGDAWQPILWRLLEERLGAHHVAAGALRLLQAPPPAGLPERVCVFGVSTLPPLYLQVFDHLSRGVDVHLFLLSPSRADRPPIGPRRARMRQLRERDRDLRVAVERPLRPAAGHPLLAALGRVARDVEQVLEELDHVEDDTDLYWPSGGVDVLHVLQDDVLALRDRAPEERAVLAPGDRSVQVLGCHSPVREIEVLRDALRALLDADETLRPRDIVVLVPDMRVHGPLIEAVFGVPPDDPLYMPYAVADRPVTSGGGVGRAVLDLLALAGGRLSAPRVMGLLAHAPVRRRFGFTELELASLEQLVGASGVRWGRDAGHRAAEGQPYVDSRTWRFGLDRMLLGHAVDEALPVFGRVPMPRVEGDLAELVGRLADFVEDLFRRLDALCGSRPLAAHAAELLALLDDWFVADVDAAEARRVRARLSRLSAEAAGGGFEAEVPLRVLRDLLEHGLAEERREGAFLRRGVTFCEMLPMRSVPARVVGLVGLSDGAFPRADPSFGFDLMARHPLRADRSRRDDDRQLVLEALLSARDALIVTYVSRSVQDNKPRPPSVVLADLLDALDRGFVGPDGGAARDHLVVHHPLQPFSPRYVRVPPAGQPALRTSDGAAVRGARALAAVERAERPFFEGPLPDEERDGVDVAELERFLVDPVLWFMERRLGVGRLQDDEPLREREPIEVDPLGQISVMERLLALRQQKLDWSECHEVLAGEGLLPLGHLANPVLARGARRVSKLLTAAAPRLEEPRRPAASVDVELDGVRVTGLVDDLREHARLQLEVSRVDEQHGRARLRAWVRHLALQLADGDRPRCTEVYALGGRGCERVLALPPLPDEEARAHLAALVQLWREGLQAPLPFLADPGWVFVSGLDQGVGAFAALKAARKRAGAFWKHRDASRRAWARLVGGERAFTRARDADRFTPVPFEGIAPRVFGPLSVVLRRSR